MIHSINTFDGKPAIKAPTEILNADILDAEVLDPDVIETNSPVSNRVGDRLRLTIAQKHSSIGRANRHLTAAKTITVIAIEGPSSASQNTAGAVQSVVIPGNTPTSSQLTNYVINSDLSTYVQPYPSMLFSAQSLSNGLRRVPSIRLPWLELGGAVAALTIISGVVFIDGLKQAKLSPSQPTAQLTSPKLTSIPKAPPLGISQMSVAELMNSGRSLPVPNNAINLSIQQIGSNSGNSGSLGMPSGNIKTVDLTQIGTIPIAANSRLPQPTTAPLMPRRPIAMPETAVTGSQVLPAPQKYVRTEPILQQPIPQPGLQQPPLTPSAFPPQEIPETPIVAPIAPALPTTSSNPADPLTYNRPDLIQAPTPPQNPSLSTLNLGTVN